MDPEDTPQSRRIFINHVDNYQGKNIAKYFSEAVCGASLEPVEDEEDDARSVDSSEPLKPKMGLWKVLGTLKDKKLDAQEEKPSFVSEILNNEVKDLFYEHIVECDVIVYDITDDPDQINEALWVLGEMHNDVEKLPQQKMFILISSIMTWAKSKPVDPEDPEIPFTEDDYRRRKPHPNFKEHLAAEKTVIKMGKTNKRQLVTFVVAAGLTYGAGENIFHYLFKNAWHNEPELKVFGEGQNILPIIQINDLAAVIQNIADARPKIRYIIAVDDSQNTLEEIVRAVSNNLGTGKVKSVKEEDALLDKTISQPQYDQLLISLRMDAVFAKEQMNIAWKAETGLVDNIALCTKEFKAERKLKPLRICVLGPPAVGKSTIVKALCDHYKLHHIHVKDVIQEALEKLEKTAALADQGEDEEGGGDEIEDDGRAQEAQELLDAINETKDPTSGKIEDQYVIKFFREKLHSKPCQNQGFIVDGFPKTRDQAAELFAIDEEEEEADEDAGSDTYDKLIMPEFIFVLEANDTFLKNRIMLLPERSVQGTHNTEQGLLKRLVQYREANTEDETVLNYFDELEIHPFSFDVTTDTSKMNDTTIKKMIKVTGEPRNYGPTPEEIEEAQRKKDEERRQKEEAERLAKEKQEAEEAAERKKRQAEWADQLTNVRREEEELLEAQATPLRNYLMRHVMPTLTKGLVECCKVRPEDPIDYLAEYLFQNNPQID